MKMMLSLLAAMAWGFSFVFTLYAGYNLLVALAGLKKEKKFAPAAVKKRFAMLIAARNEECVIGNLVQTLKAQDYPSDLYDIYVIPNNCTDDTAGAARRAGAKILECTIPVKSKGEVLTFAFDHLLAGVKQYDAFCVFDADNLVHPDFLARMNDAFCCGANVAKGKQRAMNLYDSWVAGCYDIYFDLFHMFYNRPRENVGLSAKLVGTGFAVKRDFLIKLGGWNTETMAEDAEFSSQCAMMGERVWWVPDAITYDEEPVSFAQSLVQRRRWSSGIMETAKRQIPKLLRAANKRNFKYVVDFFVFIVGPFVQLLSLFPAAWSLGEKMLDGQIQTLLLMGCATYLASAAAAAFVAIVIGKRNAAILKSAVLFPVFIISWMPLQIAAFFRKTTYWKQIVHMRSNEQNIG